MAPVDRPSGTFDRGGSGADGMAPENVITPLEPSAKEGEIIAGLVERAVSVPLLVVLGVRRVDGWQTLEHAPSG